MATILVQLNFNILLSSNYILILKCLLLRRHDLIISPTVLTYTTNIAITYQIQIIDFVDGDSLIVGLPHYPVIWRKHFKPLYAINCGIGIGRYRLSSSPFIQNVVVLCGTSNIQRDSIRRYCRWDFGNCSHIKKKVPSFKFCSLSPPSS